MGDFFSDITDVVTQPLGLSKGDAEKAQQRNLQRLEQLQAPNLQNFSYQQYATPADLQSQLGQLQVAPEGRAAQLNALQRIQDVANQGGLTAEDRAMLDQISRQEQTQLQGERGSIMQGAQRRGIAGSGLELASQLGATSQAADRQAQRDLGVAALGQNRALQALQQTASIGGQLRGADYEEAARKAEATDVINRYNAGVRNTIAQNNVDMLNRQNFYNQQQLPQQNYQNQLERLQGIGQADLAKGQMADKRGSRLLNNIGAGIEYVSTGGLGNTLSGLYNNTVGRLRSTPTQAPQGQQYSITGNDYGQIYDPYSIPKVNY